MTEAKKSKLDPERVIDLPYPTRQDLSQMSLIVTSFDQINKTKKMEICSLLAAPLIEWIAQEEHGHKIAKFYTLAKRSRKWNETRDLMIKDQPSQRGL